MKTAEVKALLADRFSAPVYSILFEVPNATGGGRGRSADALAMGLWPSRGLLLHGFEIKVSRSDWLRELKRPEKADAVCRYCDRWWIVAGSEGIVKDEELPPTWGLLVANHSKLWTQVDAPPLEPAAMDRAFLASIMRQVHAQAETNKAIEEAKALGIQIGRDGRQGEIDRTKASLASLESKLQRFEESLGIPLSEMDASQWGLSGEDLAKAVRTVLDGKHELDQKRIRGAIGALSRGRSTVENVVAMFRECQDDLENLLKQEDN